VTFFKAVKIIIAPAAKPLVQVASALGLVVCLCVILAGFIIQPFWDPNRSLYRLATYEVAVLQKIVEQYRADCGEYPSTQDWPNALVRDSGVEGWNGPYLTAVPMDPWKQPFIYSYSSGAIAPQVVSYGADQRPGGEYFKADISSRNLWLLNS
jgi:general secretion pathway protein G